METHTPPVSRVSEGQTEISLLYSKGQVSVTSGSLTKGCPLNLFINFPSPTGRGTEGHLSLAAITFV